MARFTKGGKPGPGRPKSVPRDRKFADVFKDALGPEQAFEIVSKAVEQAANGDHRAREWVFKYVVQPKPEEFNVGIGLNAKERDLEAERRYRFFDLAIESCKTVDQVLFLLSVANKVGAVGGQGDGSNDGAGNDGGAREGRAGE